MAQQGGRIDFQVGFKTDKSGIEDLKKSLQDLQKIKPMNFEGSKDDLQQIKRTAADVQAALSKAFNPNINSINLKTFDNELKASHRSIEDIYASFSKAGAQGQVAFSQMARSVLTTNQQLKQTHSLINQMGTTMVNTVKWGIASSVMNTFTSSVQGAFTYVESLEKSLTNIRIVTGDSQQKMEQFADSANRAAQELGRSTMDYTKAALTFYQQGLNDQDVQARTEAVLKAQNITGVGSEMADYMTSVWNGYKVANEQAQLYVDKLAAVADSSASDMSQLAIAMSKVASTASAMGVDVDQLNAQLATVVATTRQAPEAVGTAFKTIYTRLNDIKTGADGAEVSLGNYSGKMAELGFNVLDASGHLRDTGQIMEEIGSRWGDLTRQQQIYLATTMGGQRQVNQLMALFENWTTYSDLLNVSLEAEGTLAEKNSRYMESLGAKMEQLGAAGERVKASLIDSESFGAVIDLLTTGTNLLGTFIEGIGGGGTALLGLGGIATQVFSGVISKEINNAIVNFQRLRENEEITRQELEDTRQFGQISGFDESIVKSMVNAKSEMQEYYSVMSNAQRESFNNIVNNIGETEEEIRLWNQKIELAENFNDGLQEIADSLDISLQQQQSYLSDYLQQIQKELKDSLKIDLSDLGKGEGIQHLLDSFVTLGSNINTSTIPGLNNLINKLDEAQKEFREAKQDFKDFGGDDNEIKLSAKAARVRELIRQMVQSIQQANNNNINIEANVSGLQQAETKLDNLKRKAEEFRKQIEQEYNIKSIVNMVGALGQIASAISSLQNVGNIISDKSLNSGQKAIKVMTALGYAATSLSMSYGKINAVLKISETLQIAQLMFHTKQDILLAAQTGQVNLLTAAKIKLTAATYALNQAMIANPAMAMVTAIGLTVAAVAGAIAIYDKFTMSVKQADQAIDNYNNKVKQAQQGIRQTSGNITSLEGAKEEWETLSKRAGDYNSTIDNLTEDEKARYFELSNLIASYNDSAVAGYDEQGNAIIRNNEALEETIQLLKDKRQAEIDSLYGGEQAEKAGEGRQKKFEANQDNYNAINRASTNSRQQLSQTLLKRGEVLSKALESQQDQLSEIQKRQWKELNEIISSGIDDIYDNRGRLLQIYKSFQDIQTDTPLLSIDRLQDQIKTSNDFNKKLQESENERKDLIEQQKQSALDLLKTSDYNQIFERAEQLGIRDGTAILDGIASGIDIISQNGDLRNREDIAEDIESAYSSILDTLALPTDSGQNLYETILNAATMDRKISEGDFSSFKQQNDYIIKTIQKILQDNIKDFENLSDDQKKALESVFANIFNLEGISINFDEGKVKEFQDEASAAITRLTKRIAGDNLNVKDSLVKGTEQKVASLLRPDITAEEVDYITQHIEEAITKYGDYVTAIHMLQQEAAPIANLDTNLDTMSLLDKQASGEKLGQKEQQALISGLQTLKDSYPGLIEQVEILQTEWMQGTSAYEDALRKVKLALIDTLGDSLNQSIAGLKENTNQYKQALEDYNQKLLNLVQTTEDYQIISNLENVSLQTKQNSLIKLATAYENAKGELQKYYRVMNQENSTPEEEQTARMGLERATRAGEMGQREDIDPERIQALADRYAELASQGQQAYEGLDQNAELAVDAATRYIKLNDAITDLQQNYDKMTQVLNDLQSVGLDEVLANEDLSKAFQQLKDDVVDIVDTSEDLLSDDWIADHAGQIQAAIEGDEEAVKALREEAAQEIQLQIADDVDISGLFDTLDMAYDSVADWANNLPEGELKADDLQFVQSLTDALNEAGYTADQIEDIFSGMGIDVDLAPLADSYNNMIDMSAEAGAKASDATASNMGVNSTMVSSTDTAADTVQAAGFDAEATPVPFSYDVPTMQPSIFPGIGIFPTPGPNISLTGHYAQLSVTPKTEPIDATKETTGTSLKVEGATKSSGGKISHKNASGGNKKSSGGKKGGGKKGRGKKGGGKKGKSSTPKAPKVEKSVKDTQDRYHDVNLKLKDTETQLKKVQQQQDKLTGPELLKNLEKQQKLLDKQVETYKEKIQLEKQERDEVRNRLAKQGVTFDANGNIANYSTALSKALADYNAVIAKYNKMSAEDQQKNKYLLDDAKERYETIKSDISRYDKIVSEEIPNLEKSIQEAIDKQTQINIEKFKLKVDMELDLAEAERDFNEFRDKVKKQLRDDDILGQAKSSFADLFTYYREGYNVVQGLTDQVQDTIKQINQIDKTGNSSVYGTDRAAAVKDLKDYMEQLMKNLQEVEDLVGDIKDSVYDAIDKAQDAFDNQRKEYEQISDLIDHNQKTIEMLYGDDAYKELEKYYQLQEKNNNKELDFLRQQKDMWYNRMTSEQNRMNSLTQGTNEWKEANDRFEEYKEHWIDALNDLNDQMQKSIENIIDKYANAVDKIFKALENQLTNNKGYDHIEEEWELINKQADMYFDQVNRMYEIDKLENAYQDAIKDNDGNIKAQQSLNNLMNEQLKYLKDKDKLSQYDVDRANALLQIEIKRLALEQQRASKTKLRLRRDAQGNYTYQYTADPEANQQAEQELADAQNSLYNMTKEAYKNNLDSYYDTTTEWQDKVKDIYKDTTLTAEEQQQKIALLNEYYGEIINDLTRDNEDLKKFMMQDTFDEMAKMYDTNVENFQAMADAEKNIIMGDMVPYWKSGIQEMATSISESDEDFIPLVKDTFTELDKAASDYANSLKAIETNTGTSFDQLANGIDKNISKTQALLEANKQLIDGYDTEIAKVQDVIDKVQKLMEIYQKAKNEAIAATEAAYRFETMDASKLAANAGKVDATPVNTDKALATASDLATMSDDQLFNEFTKMLKTIYNYSSSFATGGYTGGWGDDGKIAVLHEKELVLNQKDTQNMLSAVQITRTLDDILSNFKVNIDTPAAPAILGSIPSVAENNNSEQYITINADFPAVQNQFEIEAAFDNLVNKASQYAFRTQR